MCQLLGLFIPNGNARVPWSGIGPAFAGWAKGRSGPHDVPLGSRQRSLDISLSLSPLTLKLGTTQLSLDSVSSKWD